jgi:hypothetical protein
MGARYWSDPDSSLIVMFHLCYTPDEKLYIMMTQAHLNSCFSKVTIKKRKVETRHDGSYLYPQLLGRPISGGLQSEASPRQKPYLKNN